MSKVRISLDESTVRTLDFLIEEFFSNRTNSEKQKMNMSDLRNQWITGWVDAEYKVYCEKNDK